MKLPWSTPGGSVPLAPLEDADYEAIRHLVYTHSRIQLGEQKKELVQARLAKRLRLLGIQSYPEYVAHLKHPSGAEELRHFIDVISTNHTFFFREPAHFDFLRDTILPETCPRKTPRSPPFRIWSAACSSGEEPYTLSIVLAEYFGEIPNSLWKIECTDISTRILERAQTGIFSADRTAQISPALVRKYFQRGLNDWEGHYRIKPALRQQLRFQPINLLKPPYPFDAPFDVIFCRNVMIYFDRPTQQELIAHLHEWLKPGGYLMIGHAESLTGIEHGFKSLRPAIYRKP